MKPLDLKPQDLHEWYLEATTKISKCSYNKKAQKPYEELSEEQKFIDKFVCKKIKQRTREACDFYLRYKDVPFIFCRVYPKYRNKLSEILGTSWEKWWITPIPNNSQGAIWIIKLTMMEQMHRYNEWLFKLAFKDVLEEK